MSRSFDNFWRKNRPIIETKWRIRPSRGTERGLSRSSQDHEFFPARGRGRAELLVSQTVREVVAGSGFVFEDAGMHDLKDLPGQRTPVRATNGPDHGELDVR